MAIFDFLNRWSAEESPIKRRKRELDTLMEQLEHNIQEDKTKFPEDADCFDGFLNRLRTALETHTSLPSQTECPPVDGAMRAFLTKDRMRAYACLLPPLDGGANMTEAVVLGSLRDNGVIHGIRPQALTEHLIGQKYLHLFLIACGTPPVEGQNGSITYMIAGKKSSQHLEIRPGVIPDFRELPLEIVQAGDKICRIHANKPGTAGQDVTGQILPCANTEEALVPRGKNTRVSADGQYLIANVDGRLLVEENGLCSVIPAAILTGPVLASEKSLQMQGDLYIRGDVLAGADVSVTGDLIISGKCQGANLYSGGTILVQKGVRGNDNTIVRAVKQVQAATLNAVTVEAGGSVFANVIEDCKVTSGDTVAVQGGRGFILGGDIRAKNQVICERIGNQSGRENRIAVGYIPEVSEKLETIQTGLIEVSEVLEKLRKSIHDLRQAGNTLSLEKRKVLRQLVEQRKLYEERGAKLNEEQQQLRDKIRSALAGQVICKEMYPTTVVSIGDKVGRFTLPDTNCRIHCYAGQVISK